MKYTKTIGSALALLMTFAVALPAFALHSPEHYSLFGDATYVSPGNASTRAVQLVSDPDTGGFGGIDYPAEASTTFATLTQLMTDYRLPEGDTCIGGSPRFQINVETPTGEKNIFAYFGTDSAGAPCVPGVWSSTGDFLQTGRLLDTSQLPGGAFYDPYDTALVKYGSYVVTGIQVVTDSEWATTDHRLVVDIDNTLINSTLFTYEIPVASSQNACKNGGWKTLADDKGNSFKNQGDCVSFVATKGKNSGNGR
ncbi:hypothetical protein KW782_02895 [Candidatus Parcubacteria bacterium]|nr:hypothetical protein [Candidatus Parcubacteria bacterium]